MVANRIEPLIKRYEYPDNRARKQSGDSRLHLIHKASVFSHERGILSHMERNDSQPDQSENFWFGDKVLGPVLVPWF